MTTTFVSEIEQRPASLLDKFLFGILILLSVQTLSVQALGMYHDLERCWVMFAIALIIFSIYLIISWRSANSIEREEIIGPLKWWLPWVVIFSCTIQILLYPSVMNDSLSYRLPRIYLWLQEGKICNVQTADSRINSMTTGWENLALPFYSLNMPRLCRMINLSMWIIAYVVIHHVAILQGVDLKRAGWISAALSTIPCFILQAPSSANDFFVCVLVLIALYFVLRHSAANGRVSVIASLLAIVLASNVKPQFMVLGLAWILWLSYGEQKRWKQFGIKSWLVIAFLLFFVSPGIKLLDNITTSGSIIGVPDPTIVVKQSPFIIAIANGIQFIVAQLQLPFLPKSSVINQEIGRFPGFHYLHSLVPRFGPGLTEVALIDSASLGLVHAVVLLMGCVAGWRTAERLYKIIFLCGILLFMLAATQVSVSTVGRSFMGFTVFSFPLAIKGFSYIANNLGLKICTCIGFLILIINPSHPLWPCDLAEAKFRQYDIAISDKISNYNLYRRRADTGQGMLDPVPKGEVVSVLVREVTPIRNLWTPDWKAHYIHFVHDTDAAEFEKSNCQWLLIADKAKEQFPKRAQDYEALTKNWHLIKQNTYHPNIKQGPEIWSLYQRPN